MAHEVANRATEEYLEERRLRLESLHRALASAVRKVYKLQLMIDEEEK